MVTEKQEIECRARVSSRSWGETSTKRAAMKETMLPQNILKIKCPRLAKNAYAIKHLLHHSIIYTFTVYTIRKFMHAETLASLTKPLYFPNMKYVITKLSISQHIYVIGMLLYVI
jgi:hypothetical protein